MKFKLDENLPLEIADAFRDAGHEIDSVYNEGLTGAIDEKILAAIQIEGLILLTMDKGIADIRRFPPSEYPGIVCSGQPRPAEQKFFGSFRRP